MKESIFTDCKDHLESIAKEIIETRGENEVCKFVWNGAGYFINNPNPQEGESKSQMGKLLKAVFPSELGATYTYDEAWVFRTAEDLFAGCIWFLRDYFPLEDFNVEGLRTLIDLIDLDKKTDPFTLLFKQLESGVLKKYTPSGDFGKIPSNLINVRTGRILFIEGGNTIFSDVAYMYLISFMTSPQKIKIDALDMVKSALENNNEIHGGSIAPDALAAC